MRTAARANVVGVSAKGRERRRTDPAELLRSPLFSRNSQNALRVMERLAAASLRRPSSGRSLQGIAEETGLALPTLTQLVSFLRLAGLVSQRGRSGNLRLTRDASGISVLDVIRAIDGTRLWRRCLLGLAECSDIAPCPVHVAWKVARTQLERHLGNESVANLARAVSRRRRSRRRGRS